MRISAHPLIPWLLGLAALTSAAVSARPYAGGWNDGSRLAAVESLADRHTFAIDESIFCHPAQAGTRAHPVYTPNDPFLLRNGTLDKLRIGGHYYSDKPPAISVLMAGLYQAAKAVGLPHAAERPDLFCWTMTFLTSGVAFVLAVLALHRLGQLLDLPDGLHFLWLGSFVFSTIALAYTRHVNSHILLLAVAALVCVQLAHLGRGRLPWWRPFLLGALGGLGFNLDFGCGTLLLAALFLLAILPRQERISGRTALPSRPHGLPARLDGSGEPSYLTEFLAGAIRWRIAVQFLLGAAPWLTAGLALNQFLGGVWKPLNMVPEFFDWPGSPFSPDNMTGLSRHSPGHLIVYSLALLFGRVGLIVYNLPLLLLPAAIRLARRHIELSVLLGWCAASWLLYAVLSDNYGGVCCSIRWFAPFLAPAYWALAVLLRDRPEYRRVFLVLSLCGGVLAAVCWLRGPWMPCPLKVLWPIAIAALIGSITVWFRATRGGKAEIRQCPKNPSRLLREPSPTCASCSAPLPSLPARSSVR